MNSKKWIKVFVALSFLGVAFVGGVNFVVDPLWNFSHKYDFNNVQNGFDERQQKTNYVQFRNMTQYQGVLLGSSRTTHINQNDFYNMNIFNYASSSMYPYEYKGYIDNFKKKNSQKLKYIIVGADFYGTSVPRDVKFQNPEFYITKSESFAYRFKMLFSLDGLRKSVANIKCFLNSAKVYYSRENVKYALRVSEQERFERYTKNLKRHTESFMKNKYEYNNEYLAILQALKKDNPDTKIIFFTSPITADLLVSIIKNGDKLNEYKDWLRLLVNNFGEIYHFMDISSVTTNLQNYPDDDHFYDNVAKMVANKIANVENSETPMDFGIRLNKNNLEDYLKTFETKLKSYNNPLELSSFHPLPRWNEYITK